MNQPSLYHRASALQCRDAKQIFQEYMKMMQWRSEGSDTLIDIGSGPGNVLMELIYPMLPAQFEAILATDISERMVDFARKNYGVARRAHFEVLDIACAQLPQKLCGKFDHVTSFYCLNWVQKQKRALRNIYQLLRRKGGDCLLVFVANHPIYDVYIELSKSAKWERYMFDAMELISPLHYSEDPGDEYRELLQDTGFAEFSVEIRHKMFVYEGTQSLKDNMKAISPFLERIPERQHEEFLDDIVKVLLKMKLCAGQVNEPDFKCTQPYTLAVVYARKSSDSFLK